MLALLIAGLSAATPGFVPAEDARALLSERVVVLDTRGWWDFHRGHLPGAQRVDWKKYRDGWGRTGRLGDEATIAAQLGALGVDEGRPVLVVGAAAGGFGEEGRVAWMLAYLGHPKVRLLDGGYAAFQAMGFAIERGAARPIAAGRFRARPVGAARATLADVERARSEGTAVLLDVRSDEEWAGATPYWEARPGHLPGARHLPWTSLLDERGRRLPDNVLRARLRAVGIDGTKPIVTYCTGGVRSAFAWAVLASLALAVANYDGSMYEWSRQKELPLVVGGPP